MAEVKKGGGGLPSDAETAERITTILVVLLFIGLLIGVVNYFTTLLAASGILGWLTAIWEFLKWFWPIWKVIAFILVIICIAWAIYSYFKLQEVITEEEKVYGKVADDAFSDETSASKEQENSRWEKVKEHAYSNNPADWRLAIIEADIMLEEVLRKAGFPGNGVGEMLKSVDKSDMLTLEAAWDAHKVRNRIAHSGGDFNLDERETKRVIGLFESVFKEFGVI